MGISHVQEDLYLPILHNAHTPSFRFQKHNNSICLSAGNLHELTPRIFHTAHKENPQRIALRLCFHKKVHSILLDKGLMTQ